MGAWIQSNVNDVSVGLIYSPNCWQWFLADLACMISDIISVPVYPNTTDDQLKYILHDANPTIIFIDYLDQERLNFFKRVSSIQCIISFGACVKDSGKIKVKTIQSIINNQSNRNDVHTTVWMKDRLKQTATILYTSGTTGAPKSVPLTHRNIIENIIAINELAPIDESDSGLSFLPLSHIFERTVGHYCMLHAGASITYADSIETVSKDILRSKPTILIGVPRLYEKIAQKIQNNATGMRGVLLNWAIQIGQKKSKNHLLRRLAHMLVCKKVHKRLGGRIRYLVSGGAPLSKDVELFFNSLNLPVIQGYGLTETSPIVSVNSFDNSVVGSVGQPLPYVSVRIANDGEILVKGRSVFSGYLNYDNSEVFTSDGFFKTGDLGYLTDHNYLFITGRKKELIVMSNGKNVSPNNIEEQLLHSPFISQIIVIGDNRNYLTALIVPNVDGIRRTFSISGTPESICSNDQTIALIQSEINRLSNNLSRFEQIKKFQLLHREFTVEGGDMTLTLKYKRSEINKKYAQSIETMYDKFYEPFQ